jgi:hypothetical protein
MSTSARPFIKLCGLGLNFQDQRPQPLDLSPEDKNTANRYKWVGRILAKKAPVLLFNP